MTQQTPPSGRPGGFAARGKPLEPADAAVAERGGGFGGARGLCGGPTRNVRRGEISEELMTDEQLKEMEASATGSLSREQQQVIDDWVPKTEAGRLVKSGEVKSMEELWSRHLPILESEIVDVLVPDLQEQMIDTRKTTYVRASGRKFNFAAFVLVGDGKKYIGLGMGSDKERFPAIRKAGRDARLKLMPVRVGSGSWEDLSNTTRSVPFKVTGKAGSVRVTLYPAPQGTGLVVGKQIQEVFRFAGITDVWGTTKGSSDTELNYVRAASTRWNN